MVSGFVVRFDFQREWKLIHSFYFTPTLKDRCRAAVPNVTGFHRLSTIVHAQLNVSCVKTLLLNPTNPQLQSLQAYLEKMYLYVYSNSKIYRNWMYNRKFKNYSLGKSKTCLWLPGWALSTTGAGQVEIPGTPGPGSQILTPLRNLR